jgi:formylglycine-generating enzyme required for sulfatase activity
MKKIESPNPYERALAYDLLGRGHEDHRPGLRLTDLSWSETIQPGTYAIGGDASAVESLSVRLKRIELPYPFAVSSFLVTNEQFSAFEEADRQAYQTGNPRPWWLGLPAQEANMTKLTTALYNYPRDTVSYWQGLAFCRWLTRWMRERGDLETNEAVDLPSDFEWEIATRCEGKLYPWGHITFADVYYPSYANVDETDGGKREGFRLGRSCAVGIYENDRTHNGIYDVCGNLLQWCHAYNAAGDVQSLRGAPWSSKPRSLASRLLQRPNLKNGIIGLRLVKRPKDAPFNKLTMKS